NFSLYHQRDHRPDFLENQHLQEIGRTHRVSPVCVSVDSNPKDDPHLTNESDDVTPSDFHRGPSSRNRSSPFSRSLTPLQEEPEGGKDGANGSVFSVIKL
ncbi:hypothetical protein OSTOST_07200, partial [Ostertagia ostertagi]